MKKNKKEAPIRKMAFKIGTIHGETIFNPTSQKIGFVLKDQEVIDYHASKEIDGRLYVPLPQVTSLIASGAVRLASKASPYYSTKDLRKRIQALIHKYVDLPPSFELICTYYVLLSWRYDQFNELPYLRVRGDFGSGKTRFLNVIGSLTYNSIFASGASTTAPIFHLLDSLRGTLVLDESDYRYSDATAEITKILNNGHAKGFSVLRCEPTKDGGFVARAYSIFGPKIVAARESFSDTALESRFVTCDLDASPIRGDIPISLPSSFDAETMDLRNQLMWYRLHATAATTHDNWDSADSLSARTKQIYQPLLSLVEDKKQLDTITAFIAEQESQLRSDRGLQTEADLLRVLFDLSKAQGPITLGEVTNTFMIRYGNRYTRRITPKWVGYLLRSRLHLATRKSNGVYIISEGQTDRLSALYQKYDVI